MTMRRWWIDEIATVAEYSGCTLDSPPSVFEDKTLSLGEFNRCFTSEKLANVTRAMDNCSVLMNNVMCPWKCSSNCLDAGRLPYDIMVQRMLPTINLILYSEKDQYRKVQFSSNSYSCVDGECPTILLNNEWKVKPAVLVEGGCLKILTCKFHDGGRNKLTLFAPSTPHGHVLNARLSDQLSPCVRKHRVARQMKARKFCTTYAMYTQYSNYEGVCTMDLVTNSNFASGSELLSQHQAASIVGRNDINLLLSRKVERGEISVEMQHSFARDAAHRFNEDKL